MNDAEAKSSPSTEAHAAKFEGPHPVFLRFRFNLKHARRKCSKGIRPPATLASFLWLSAPQPSVGRYSGSFPFPLISYSRPAPDTVTIRGAENNSDS
jgi:hypothetical protein